MRRIVFQGTPSVKCVDHYAHPEVEAEVTPLVVIQDGKNVWGEHEFQWGIIYQCIPQSLLQEIKEEDLASAMEPFEIDETFEAWSDPARWWRALELLRGMPVLGFPVFQHLWLATGRIDPDDEYDQRCIEEIRSTFAEGYDYDEIMARPVPLEVVQLAIQLFDEGLDMNSLCYDLTDEIEAGTIRWSQELKRIGVVHPEYRQAMQAARATVVERYRDHLFSYAAFRECPYSDDKHKKGFIMICIESNICAVIQRGIESQYGMDITAMLGILSEEITHDDILEKSDKKHPREREGCIPFVRTPIEERFEQVLNWMEHFSATPVLPDDLNTTLHQLYEKWESMPIINPLVS